MTHKPGEVGCQFVMSSNHLAPSTAAAWGFVWIRRYCMFNFNAATPFFCWVMHFLTLLRSSRRCQWITFLSAWHCLCQGAEACSYQTRLEAHLVTALWRWQGMGLIWSSIHSASCHFFAGKGNKLKQFIHWIVSTSHIYYLFHVVHSHLNAEFQRVEVKSHR